MINNSALRSGEKCIKELERERSCIQARYQTEHDLSEDLKHTLWMESKQVDALVDCLLGMDHG